MAILEIRAEIQGGVLITNFWGILIFLDQLEEKNPQFPTKDNSLD